MCRAVTTMIAPSGRATTTLGSLVSVRCKGPSCAALHGRTTDRLATAGRNGDRKHLLFDPNTDEINNGERSKARGRRVT